MVNITPSNPSSSDSIAVSIHWHGCVLDRGIDQVGTTFNIHYNYSNICFATAPGGTGTFELGSLPAGAYTVNYVQTITGNLISQETASFEVSAADAQTFAAPALSPIGLGILLPPWHQSPCGPDDAVLELNRKTADADSLHFDMQALSHSF